MHFKSFLWIFEAYEVAASVRKSDLLIDTFQKQFEEWVQNYLNACFQFACKHVLKVISNSIESVNRIYVVHEIFYVDLVRVSCTIGVSQRGGKYQEIENKRFEHRGRIPIAFVCDKFPVNERVSFKSFLSILTIRLLGCHRCSTTNRRSNVTLWEMEANGTRQCWWTCPKSTKIKWR